MPSVEEADYSWIEDVEALSITCVRGLDAKGAIKMLELHRIGRVAHTLDEADEALMDSSDTLDHGPVQVFRRNGWTVIVELNGWKSSLPESLELLAGDGIAANVFWNINSVTQFGFAMSGQLIRRFEPGFGSDGFGEPLPLEAGLDFDSPDDCLGSAMVLMQRLTGLALTDDEILGQSRLCYHPDAKAARAAGRQRSADEADHSHQQFRDQVDTAAIGELIRWRGLEPTAQMRAVASWRLPTLAREDWQLAEQLLGLDLIVQRRLAIWSARWAVRHAGRDSEPVFVQALDALDSGHSLPPQFDSKTVWDDLRPESQAEPQGPVMGKMTAAIITDQPMVREPVAAWVTAISAVKGAAKADPVTAAIEALVAALSALADPTELFADARRFIRSLSSE